MTARKDWHPKINNKIKMGTYKLSLDEVHGSMRDWLESLEGDFDAEDICMAFNKVAKREKWDERIKLITK